MFRQSERTVSSKDETVKNTYMPCGEVKPCWLLSPGDTDLSLMAKYKIN